MMGGAVSDRLDRRYDRRQRSLSSPTRLHRLNLERDIVRDRRKTNRDQKKHPLFLTSPGTTYVGCDTGYENSKRWFFVDPKAFAQSRYEQIRVYLSNATS